MLTRPYEMLWRTPYELLAALAWAVAALHLAWTSAAGPLPAQFAIPAGLACAAMALRRGLQGLQVWRHRAALAGRAVETISFQHAAHLHQRADAVFLGFGFDWQPVHAQRLHELSKLDARSLVLPRWPGSRRSGQPRAQPDAEIGLPFIHGLEPAERALYRPLQNFEGGTLLVGTTQAGKGVALSHLIAQAVRRGDVVIVIDPKNSHRLKRVTELACAHYREPGCFLEFHPAFPERGVRLDFTFNWQKPTEIASRIQSIMPVDTGGAFSAFGWDAVNVVVQGLVALEERPNLAKLTRYIEGGLEPLLEALLRRFLEAQLGAGWRSVPALVRLMQEARRGNVRRPSEAASADLVAMVGYYEHFVAAQRHDKVIDAQVRVFRHNREHYQKITANLLPLLSMLTSGDLGRTLSPDPFDATDLRPMMNLEKIERGRHVLYMALDSLPDPSVATAIGALALADLAARAGMRYNLGQYQRIALFVDEVSNVINPPLIEILNKGAEGGIFTTCAMQTLADLSRRLGSEDAARMALGNLNNLIALRTKDRPTQDFVVETFGRTSLHAVRVGLNQGTDTHPGDFSAGASVQVAEEDAELVSADVLGKLPNLQYFASVSGGRILKGRWPILLAEPAPPTNA